VTTDRRPSPRGPGVVVMAAAGTSGVAGYVVLVLAARALSPAENADFLVFWGALFAVFGVLSGVTSETTRTVFAARGAGRTGPAPGARVVPVALTLGGVVVAVVGLTGPLWAPALFGPDWLPLLAAMVSGIALFVVHSTLGGAAAGRGLWSGYAVLVGAEALARLALCALVALLGGQVLGLAWAVGAASGTWLLLSLSPRYRRLWSVRGDVPRRGLSRRMASACTAAGASSLLLVGFPVLLRLTTSDEVFAGAAPLLLAVSLTRAPLLVPLGAYQNVVVTRVLSDGLRALVAPTRLVLALTALGAAVAGLAGPAAMRVINPDYHVAGVTFVALMAAAGLVALLTLTGAASLALDHHTVYLLGWTGATLTALAVLAGPWGLEARLLAALVAGPVVGMGIHLAWSMAGSARLGRPRPLGARETAAGLEENR
jgi:O-antigen/teichoic acid export membrane protein